VHRQGTNAAPAIQANTARRAAATLFAEHHHSGQREAGVAEQWPNAASRPATVRRLTKRKLYCQGRRSPLSRIFSGAPDPAMPL